MFNDAIHSPWFQLTISLLVAGAVAMLVGFRRDPRRFGDRRTTRLGVLGLSLLAFLCFALAAANPSWIRAPEGNAPYLALVLDVSDSVLLANPSDPPVQRRTADHLRRVLSATSAPLRTSARAGLLTLRGSTTVARDDLALTDLPAALTHLARSDFAGGEGSRLDLGLDRAATLIANAGGSGAVLLVSDGNETAGDALASAQRLAAKGIPIHVLPLSGAAPGLALTAANLPPRVLSGVPAFLRGTLFNGGDQPATVDFSASLDPVGDGNVVHAQVVLPPDSFHRLRTPVTFTGVGLHVLDLNFVSADNTPPIHRRFFTHVNRPPKLLSVGGDHRWTGAFDEEQALITKADDLNGVDFLDLDAVVLGATPADKLDPADMRRLHDAVVGEGLGLMFINGDHAGRKADQPNLLMSYLNTPLEPLLPVSPQPRPFDEEPPPRQVVVLIDASGSMGGWKLQASKKITAHIIQNLLRPIDRLDLLAFSTGVDHLVVDRPMDAGGAGFALAQLNTVQAGGGTNPTDALELIQNRHFNHCGLIFISDGGFAPVKVRPECRSTVFAVGWDQTPESSPLWEFADPIPVPPGFSPGGIEIPFFEPEPRDRFYEEAPFSPLAVGQYLPRGSRLEVPEQPLPGNAVTYPLPDSLLIAVRPKETDPVLVYRNIGLGTTGVFTSAINDAWLERDASRAAVAGWIQHLIPYEARDRYYFDMRDQGLRAAVTISVTAPDGPPPRVSQLNAVLIGRDGSRRGIPMEADPLAPAVFHGVIPLPKQGVKTVLELTEAGPDALARPQRVPLVLPAADQPRGPRAERWSWGEHRALLQTIAGLGGGIYDPEPDQPLLRRPPPGLDKTPFRPALTLAGAAIYLMAFGLRRWNP